ncbi:hemolysin XhlA family protein [Paenibacillus sp. MAHUQ-46]|uniref:Hemolysin XhlA family protein n=2 Tax=Paenibacillus TaxID=44249 RepID=A0A934J878_9BACL|nr:hemolysin XhlA family protein [Paenibacillus roseus]
MINVRLDIRELGTKVDAMKDVRKEVEIAKDDAKEALQYAKSGQHQINELKESNKWLKRTVATSLITGVIGWMLTILFRVLEP